MIKNKALRESLKGLLIFEDRFEQVPERWARWLCERLAWHKVLPLAAAIQDPGKPKTRILSGILNQTCLHNMMREEHYFKQVRSLFGSLDKKGIEYVPFKGPFWFVPIYESYHWRHIGDIDLLLPKADLPIAIEMMKELGYRPHCVTASLEQELAERGELAFYPDPSHPNDVVVELHWDPMPSPRFMRRQYLCYDDFVCRTVPGQWRGLSYAMPSLEVQFLYLVLHAACQHQFMRFVHVTTIVHYIQKVPQLNYKEVFDLAASRHAGTPLFYGLSFANAFWRLPEPLRELKARIRVPFKSRLVTKLLPPRRIIQGTDKKGVIRRNLFRTAISWQAK